MNTALCESCGTNVDVAPVTYSVAGGRTTQPLCADCKQRLLGRRRTRSRREPAGDRAPAATRLSRILREGGVQAYLGVGFFALGIVLVPVLILVSLLTR